MLIVKPPKKNYINNGPDGQEAKFRDGARRTDILQHMRYVHDFVNTTKCSTDAGYRRKRKQNSGCVNQAALRRQVSHLPLLSRTARRDSDASGVTALLVLRSYTIAIGHCV